MAFRCILSLTFLISLPIFAQMEEQVPATRQEAPRKSGLTGEDIAALESNRILITNDTFKQIFFPYISRQNPLFITSDSLLNAYHVLYEESIVRLENSMATRLPGILRLILQNIDLADDYYSKDPELLAAAKTRAILVTGIALKLVDDSYRLQNADLDNIMSQEAERIIKAEGRMMPDWLGKPDVTFAAIDYSRYKPRGFYTRSEKLQRYFRAVSWLQSIPFRVSDDAELLSILLLGNTVTRKNLEDVKEGVNVRSFFRAYTSFIGAGDDWDLMTAAERAQNPLGTSSIEDERVRLMEMAAGYGEGRQINDQLRFAPEDMNEVAEPNFRIISAYSTPDAILFQKTTDIRKFDRPYPNGLEVAAALGSAFARNNLQDPQKEQLLATIASCQTYFSGESLYLKYLEVLKALLDDPAPDAPDFMTGEAWQAKSCNTVLAGWAQLRHTWALQAKQSVTLMGEAAAPEGFVEPVPDFFLRMALLAQSTRSLLRSSGAFGIDYDTTVSGLEKFCDILHNAGDKKDVFDNFRSLRQEYDMIDDLALRLLGIDPWDWDIDWDAEGFREEKAKMLAAIVDDIKSGRPDSRSKLERIFREVNPDLDGLWQSLEQISRRLEIIAHKQLRQVTLDKSETKFIMNYGRAIARIMFYEGNSYLSPKDDAPKAIDVHANPELGGYLHVGVARPRKIYVLYPWQGKTVFCEGAVMPYYEFVNDSRLTDEEWKAILDSDRRPPIPGWFSSVVKGGNLGKPNIETKYYGRI